MLAEILHVSGRECNKSGRFRGGCGWNSGGAGALGGAEEAKGAVRKTVFLVAIRKCDGFCSEGDRGNSNLGSVAISRRGGQGARGRSAG